MLYVGNVEVMCPWCSSFYFWQLPLHFKIHKSCVHLWKL